MMAHRLKHVAQRFGVLWGRLPRGRLLRIAAARGILRWLEPELIPSYAQFGEDRFFDAFFGGRDHGLYVDVGCNRPIAYSNTWKLYLRGWHGLVIDANPALIAEHTRVRPADIALAEVISTSTEPVDFYIPHASDLIAGIGEKKHGHWLRNVDNSEVIRYQPTRLGELLRRHGMDRHFDLLTVDTEGNELDVLYSLDLGHFLPALIAVEIHNFEIATPANSPINTMLVRHGYSIVGYLRPTVFFAL